MKRICLTSAVAGLALAMPVAAGAAESYPTKAPKPDVAEWTGLYLGGHFGYAYGWSGWSASDALSTASGSTRLFISYAVFCFKQKNYYTRSLCTVHTKLVRPSLVAV